MAFDRAEGRRPLYLHDELWRLLTVAILICVAVGTLTYRAGAASGAGPEPAPFLTDGTGYVLRPVGFEGVRYLVHAYPSAARPRSLDLFASGGRKINTENEIVCRC